METTQKHNLPYIMAAQAQKHVTHNEALRTIDSIIHIAVLSRTASSPPTSPQASDGYLIPSGATGVWSDKENTVQVWEDEAWATHVPQDGWAIWVRDENKFIIFDDGQFQNLEDTVLADLDELANIQRLAINSAADANNRLSLQANSSLFSHEGNDHRLTINKAQSADTASIIFQNGWSARAEMGLVGDDNYSFKVSIDGSTYAQAIQIAADSGEVSLPNSNFLSYAAFNLFQDAGRMGSGNTDGVQTGNFNFPAYLSLYNGSTANGLAKFIHNNSTHGGTAGILAPSVDDLVTKIRDAGYRRYGAEFWVAEITHGSGTGATRSAGGDTYYQSLYNRHTPRLSHLSHHIYIRAIDNPVYVFKASSSTQIRLDGTFIPGPCLIQPADGWVSVLIWDSLDLRKSNGYAPSFLSVYCQSAGDKWQFAYPALCPGQTLVAVDTGILSAFNHWVA